MVNHQKKQPTGGEALWSLNFYPRSSQMNVIAHLPVWVQWGCCGCESRLLPAGRWMSLLCLCSELGPASPAGACGAATASEWTHWRPDQTGAVSPGFSVCCETTLNLQGHTEERNVNMEIYFSAAGHRGQYFWGMARLTWYTSIHGELRKKNVNVISVSLQHTCWFTVETV